MVLKSGVSRPVSRRMGFAPGSAAYQTCVSTITQQRNQLSNQINQMQHGGFD
jgi:hypothetical protein